MNFAVVGAGFWARYQIAAWREVGGARCVAVCDLDKNKAEALARALDIPAVYDNAATMLARESPDFLDIITGVDTHARLVHLAAAHGVPVICQKPLAPTLAAAQEMVTVCENAGVPFLVHENWRWQTPLRALKRVLEGGRIGAPFRARVQFACSFPVFDNQPFLAELDQFILTDIGSHILDAARFLFGEARTLVCHTRRVHADIKGEDVATVLLSMGAASTTVVCEMSYASRLADERFPQTYVVVEGEKGSAELGFDYAIRVTTGDVTETRRFPPPRFSWADPAYDLVQSSMVPCCADLLGALKGERTAETTGGDNLETARLVFAAYDSARTGQVVSL